MNHLISINNINLEAVDNIFNLAKNFLENGFSNYKSCAKDKILVNLFFENSTRTKTSFEIAAKLLGCKVVNLNIETSSLNKGEGIIDTAKTINAMRPNFVVVRHHCSGFAKLFSCYINQASVINAGDGTNEHPTQALLDLFTILLHRDSVANLKIAICGDIFHSRVAHSNLNLLSKLGANISLASPPTLAGENYKNWLKNKYNANLFYSINQAIIDANIIMLLRLQNERMSGCYISSSAQYFNEFGLNLQNIQLANKNVLVMHPGPINREVEICSNLADSKKYSLILNQVNSGVVVRAALIDYFSKLQN
jgi:aspartate carbamoyltransferase catalytic subunit